MSDDLPAWVYDVVIELHRWADGHPDLYGEFFDVKAGKHRLQRVDDCGCKALALVPADVQAQARALATYLSRRADDQAEIEQLRKNLDGLVATLDERSDRLAKALGLERPLHYEYMTERVEELRQETT